MNTNPAASVPMIAPQAPAANIAPSARPEWSGWRSTAICDRMGAGMPAKKEGRKKTRNVSTTMAETGSSRTVMTGPATARSRNTAPAVVSAARIIAQPLAASARGAGHSAMRPPTQCPAENPARTTAMIEVQV